MFKPKQIPALPVGTHKDSYNLFIIVKKTGKIIYQCRYTLGGKPKTKKIGDYPALAIDKARERRDEILEKAGEGVNPFSGAAINRDDSFGAVAQHYLQTLKNDGVSTKYLDRIKGYIDNDLGDIDAMKIERVEPKHLIEIRDLALERGMEVATETVQVIRRIIEHGYDALSIGTGADITRGHIKYLTKVKQRRPKPRGNPHILDAEFSELGKALAKFRGWRSVLCIAITIHTFVRSNEIREATWSEIDFDKKEWTIPLERMKSSRVHIVPLTEQVLEFLRLAYELHPNPTPDSKVIYPKQGSECVAPATLSNAIQSMGFKDRLTVHGIRHTASTWLNERKKELELHEDWIEYQLAHLTDDGVRGVYNHAKYLEDRRKMLTIWSERWAFAGVTVKALTGHRRGWDAASLKQKALNIPVRYDKLKSA